MLYIVTFNIPGVVTMAFVIERPILLTSKMAEKTREYEAI